MNQAVDNDTAPRGRRPGIIRRRLQWRIMLLVTIGIAAILVAFTITSLLAVTESIERTLDERQALAQETGGHVDYVVRQSLKALDEIPFGDGFDLEDPDPEPEQRVLRRAFFGTIFSRGVYLTDADGRLLWMEPEQPSVLGTDISHYPHVRAALESGGRVVSGLATGVADGGSVASMIVPVRNRSGRLVGLVGGDIGLSGTNLQEIIHFSALGKTGYAQIVDSQGTILASTRPGQALETTDHRNQIAALIQEKRTSSGTCHECHESANGAERQTEVMAFAPLQSAPWGVLIRESEDEALAPARRLKERAIWLGIGAFAIALLFSWAMVRSVTRPVAVLTAAAQRIASGDLSGPVPDLGQDEIGHLAMAFETMRTKLNDSQDTIQAWGRELEARVQERTREMETSRDNLRAVAEENVTLYEELKRKEAARSDLLKKVIGAQEDERRRIARELHDETSQSLTALVVGLETASLTSRTGRAKLQQKLASLKELAVETLERVHDLIYDLRPSVLDDLGLAAGLRWYAESRLQPGGARVRLRVKGMERRLPAEAETALFRIGQEAINNAARHAHASAVLLAVTFEDSRITLEMDDNGEGFNLAAMGESTAGRPGWGLMGMQERATLLGGTLEIVSEPGSGTHVKASIPLEGESGDNAKDPRAHSR